MYLEYYGLTEAPFDITPNPRFLFYSAKHREAFNHLLYGIRERKGFVQLTGEVGAGKTTLCRAAMELEELAEWLLAHAQANLVGVADALGDRLYLLLGDAVATGLPLAELFSVVHESNMSKLGGVHTGLGKGVKGPGYARPRIAEVLAQHGCPRQE